MQDDIYKKPLTHIKPFEFDERVADVFPDMISRSVPGYSAGFALIAALTRHYAQENTALYDLGCSLGAATLAMRHSLSVEGCNIVAIDNSQAMTQRCERLIERDHASTPVEIVCDDIVSVSMHNASVVVMHYTLQFIPLEKRLPLLQKIQTSLHQGGAFLLSEKIVLHDEDENQRLINLHSEFKRVNGYNDLEIAQKRSAIENVLVPETEEQHIARLYDAGFASVQKISQTLNFITLLATK